MFDFTGQNLKRLQELEANNKILLAKVKDIDTNYNNIQRELSKKPKDYENNIRYDSKMITEYKNRINKNSNEVEDNLGKIELNLQKVLENQQSSHETLNEIQAIEERVIAKNNEIASIVEEFNTRNDKLVEHLSNFETIILENPNFEGEFNHMIETIEKSEDISSKIITLHKSALSKKKEVDDLYNSIIGYESEDEKGEVVVVEGLKDKLEKQYNHLNKKITGLKEIVDNIREESKKENDKLISSTKKKLEDNIEEWNSSYELTEQKLDSLLPRALTTGLSYAYSKKKEEEEVFFEKSSILFNWGIGALVVVSLIPFGISLYFLINNYLVEEIIQKMPRLVLTILPLYLPVLWLAYSANKRINLSKRLIEEYAHKEVLSKTYEGLSTQVNNIDSESFSEELKVKLLYNLLQISSENPGKLISNYEKSDHPIMDVLEQSSRLTKSIDKLKEIPGMNKLAEFLNTNKNRIIENEDKRVTKGLEEVESQKEE